MENITTTLERSVENKQDQTPKKSFLYPFQKGMVLNDSPRQIYNKSRQIGFSLGLAVRAYMRGLKKPRFEALYASVGERLSTEWLDKVRTLVMIDNIVPIVDKNTEIRLPNGSRFISLPQNPATVRSYSPDEIYLDEFAHWQKDKETMTALAPSLSRKDKQRILIIGSTPFGQNNIFHKLYTNTKFKYHRETIDINEAIKQGCPLDYENCRENSIDEESFQQEYLCQFIDDVSSFFPYELIKSCWNVGLSNMAISDLANIKNPLYAGYDPAKKVDSGLFYIVEKVGDKFITRHIKEWQSVKYSEQMAYIKDAMFVAKITRLKMDRTGVGEKLYEDLENIFHGRLEGITFTNSIKEKMIIDLKVLFQEKLIEIPYNMILTHQLHSLNRVITEAKNTRYTHAQGQHDDYVWALAMAVRQSEMPKVISVRTL